MPILQAEGLSAGYGAVPAIHSIDVEVHAGEVVALLGANGAGKTTVLRALAGELAPLEGDVRWDGRSVRSPLHRRARHGMRYVTEERSVFMQLSVHENLRLGGGSSTRALELFPELEPLLRRRAGLLSGGEQQMLTLARALSCQPRVLLADELSLGLAPMIVQRLLAAVRDAAESGVAVVLVEQQLRGALAVADRGYVMRRGRVVLQGTAANLHARIGDVEAAYLNAPSTEALAVSSPAPTDIDTEVAYG